MEQYIKSKTSNISTKPVQEGREKCDQTKVALERYRELAERKVAQFVLHPLLTLILEQIENFTMGEIIVRPKNQKAIEERDEVPKLVSKPTTLSNDPSKTTFMRSNSSKLINLSSKESKSGGSSRKNAARTSNNRHTGQSNSFSGQNSSVGKQNFLNRSNSMNADKSKASRQLSVQQSENGKGKSFPPTKQPKFLKRTMTDVNRKQSQEEQSRNGDAVSNYRNITGLKATIIKRSATAPLTNLISAARSTFASIAEELPAPVINYKETLEMLKHDNNCYITGITVLENGNIVVCDNVHDSLQMYNPEHQCISELECLHPWGVIPVSETAVAVTLHYDHKVVLVKAVDTLEQLKEKDILLKCKSSLCFDIKFYAFRLYVLCINSDIHVLDLKGKEYSVIRTGITTNTLKYIDVDIENKELFVSGESGIACLDYKGLPLWHYKVRSKGKLFSTGIIRFKGRLLFCDWANHCLKELYEEGTKIRTVFTETIEKPLAITADRNGETIIFSQGDYDMDINKSRIIRVLNVQPIDVLP